MRLLSSNGLMGSVSGFLPGGFSLGRDFFQEFLLPIILKSSTSGLPTGDSSRVAPSKDFPLKVCHGYHFQGVASKYVSSVIYIQELPIRILSKTFLVFPFSYTKVY